MNGRGSSADDPRTVPAGPRAVREIEHVWIPLADGCRLAARIWLPADAEARPVPALLEYLPYRKRDGTAERDARSQPYLAGRGYACVRVDLRGCGESDGLLADEYLAREQDDALEVIDWIAARPWCTGRVGMWGISWGGFNALQVAARRPPALAAIVTVCSTDDRYADDIHYKGGCLLMENLGWASTMFAYQSRPPDPALYGEGWREAWRERLEHLPLLVETWLGHPHRDAYWRHGSVCEDFAAIETPTLAVGGWGDAYHNAVSRLVAGIRAPVRGIVGPWVHQYPHLAIPAPRIGFLQESLRWWDRWLKGADTGVEGDPAYRAYVMESAPPAARHEHRAGRWVAEPEWPSPRIEPRPWHLAPRRLAPEPGAAAALTVRSPQDTGTAGGEYCAIWLGPEAPTDQRPDDAGSLVFDSEPLAERTVLLGTPVLELEVAADRPVAMVAARLGDVRPGGEVTRLSWGVLNLCHRDGHADPRPLEPGRPYRVRMALDDLACALPPGHRLRLSLSSAYWPMVWPSPEAVTLTVHTAGSRLVLPVRDLAPDEPEPAFPPAEAAPPEPVAVLRPPRNARRIVRDVASGLTEVRILDDFGSRRLVRHGLEVAEACRERHRIHPGDPLSCRAEVRWTEGLRRGEWSVRTDTRTRMWADRTCFHLSAALDAFEGERRVARRRWRTRVPRRLV